MSGASKNNCLNCLMLNNNKGFQAYFLMSGKTLKCLILKDLWSFGRLVHTLWHMFYDCYSLGYHVIS